MAFCQKCGKEIGEAKFCQYCGKSSDNKATVTINLISNDVFTTIKEKIMQIGHEKLIKLIAWISTFINLIIRVVKNEVEVVYNFLAQDDYYVVSESGRNYMLIIIALQVILSVLLYRSAKKEQMTVSKKAIILSVILLALEIFAMIVRLPAPY